MRARRSKTDGAREGPPAERGRAACARPEADGRRPPAPIAGAEAGTCTVLIVVDENRNVREFCKRELELAGHHVRLAADPVEAIRMLDADGADLVVTDIVESTGVDFRAFLAHMEDRGVPVIAYTADPLYLFEVLFWSVEASVEKNGDMTELKREIAKALKRRAARRAALEGRGPMRPPESEGRSRDDGDGTD